MESSEITSIQSESQQVVLSHTKKPFLLILILALSVVYGAGITLYHLKSVDLNAFFAPKETEPLLIALDRVRKSNSYTQTFIIDTFHQQNHFIFTGVATVDLQTSKVISNGSLNYSFVDSDFMPYNKLQVATDDVLKEKLDFPEFSFLDTITTATSTYARINLTDHMLYSKLNLPFNFLTLPHDRDSIPEIYTYLEYQPLWEKSLHFFAEHASALTILSKNNVKYNHTDIGTHIGSSQYSENEYITYDIAIDFSKFQNEQIQEKERSFYYDVEKVTLAVDPISNTVSMIILKTNSSEIKLFPKAYNEPYIEVPRSRTYEEYLEDLFNSIITFSSYNPIRHIYLIPNTSISEDTLESARKEISEETNVITEILPVSSLTTIEMSSESLYVLIESNDEPIINKKEHEVRWDYNRENRVVLVYIDQLTTDAISLYNLRIKKLLLHAIGEFVGFGSSPRVKNKECVMYPFKTVAELDRIGDHYCEDRAILQKVFSYDTASNNAQDFICSDTESKVMIQPQGDVIVYAVTSTSPTASSSGTSLVGKIDFSNGKFTKDVENLKSISDRFIDKIEHALDTCTNKEGKSFTEIYPETSSPIR